MFSSTISLNEYVSKSDIKKLIKYMANEMGVTSFIGIKSSYDEGSKTLIDFTIKECAKYDIEAREV